MSSQAQWDQMAEGAMYQATGTESANGLRQIGAGQLQREAAERLAAHRSRRATEQALLAALAEPVRPSALVGTGSGRDRSSALRVREAVAARYEQSLSYHEFLAAEADRVLQQAQAEAEVAARKAKAVAEAKIQLMEEIEQWTHTGPEPNPAATAGQKKEMRAEVASAPPETVFSAKEPEAKTPGAKEATRELSLGGLRVRLYDAIGTAPLLRSEAHPGKTTSSAVGSGNGQEEDELQELEQEIEFRAAPEFEPHVLEEQAIPGNLIEFPRQLVASRKSRPRLAEGPLRADAPEGPQLRIFEVDADILSKEPSAAEIAAAPDWQSLLLDYARTPAPAPRHDTLYTSASLPQAAPLGLRLMAAAVDLLCVGVALAAFAAVVMELVGNGVRTLPLPLLGASAASVLLLLFVGYQVLFFSLNGATPGMRCARIGLCTFGDRNPSRRAMRRRVLAMLLAACPLGLGLAWACMDEERLGWHDRMSRMYQRAY